MSRYQDQIRDEFGAPVIDATVYVYKTDGSLETLTDDAAVSLANPVTTDAFGVFYFNCSDGQHELAVHFNGSLRWKEIIVVGAAGTIDSTAVTPQMFGAVGNGVANDRAAFVSAEAATAADTPIIVPSGSYLISSDLTISRRLDFQGGKLVIPTGVTVTLNAGIDAAPVQVFQCSGTGVAVLDASINAVRYPEWWGGIEGADCSAAFAQALKTGTTTVCQARDYVISSTLAIPAFATLKGAGHNYEGTDTATRILMASASTTICQLGSTGTPVDLNSAPFGATAIDVYFARNQAPTAGAIGVLVGWSRYARLQNVRSAESIIAFRFTNSIRCVCQSTAAKRATAIASGTDQFYGYDIDGTGALPAAGGNASLFLIDAQAECDITIADSIAFRLNGRITDTFIRWPETIGFSYALHITGDAAGSPISTSNTDVTVESPVFDATTVRTVHITQLNKWGSVKIINPYFGPASGAEGLRATSCSGHIGIIGGQIRMTSSAAAAAVVFDTCRAPSLDKTSIAECGTQAVILTGVSGGYISPVTINCTNTLSAAVQSVANVTDTVIEPFCNGDNSKVSIGYQSLAASNNYNSIRRTGMTRAVVTTKVSAAGAEAASSLEGVA
jgi:hypothetical protein